MDCQSGNDRRHDETDSSIEARGVAGEVLREYDRTAVLARQPQSDARDAEMNTALQTMCNTMATRLEASLAYPREQDLPPLCRAAAATLQRLTIEHIRVLGSVLDLQFRDPDHSYEHLAESVYEEFEGNMRRIVYDLLGAYGFWMPMGLYVWLGCERFVLGSSPRRLARHVIDPSPIKQAGALWRLRIGF